MDANSKNSTTNHDDADGLELAEELMILGSRLQRILRDAGGFSYVAIERDNDDRIRLSLESERAGGGSTACLHTHLELSADD